MRLPLLFGLTAGLAVSLTIVPNIARADPRPFTFVYDTYAVGKGNVEYEQWVTYEARTDDEPSFERLRLRHEFEFGLADNFDLAVYVASWRYEETEEHTGTRFESASIEGILYLSNPSKDFVGVGLYNEFAVGENELEHEFKLLLHKDFDKWTVAYNLTLETEIEGVFDDDEENEVEGIIGHAFGVSYAITPQISVGGEAVIESVYEDWESYEHTTVYAGPKFSYFSGEHLWFTITPTFQLSSEADEPDFVTRLIVGYEF